MAFVLPNVSENPTGWGPPKTDEGLNFDIPYQHFFKGDRISKIADWITDNRGNRGRVRGRYWATEAIDEEEKNWTTADYTKNTTRHYRFYRAPRGRGGRGGMQAGRGGPRKMGGRGQGAVGKPKRKPDHRDNNFRRRDQNQKASTEVKANWSFKSAINIADLSKALSTPEHPTPKVTDMLTQGEPLYYNEKVEKLASNKTPLTINKTHKVIDEGPLVRAPNTREIVKKLESKVKVFASDTAMATLMAAPKSVLAWDMTIERVGDVYFIDWGEGSTGNKWTVNETATEAPPLEATDENQKHNSQPRLMEELTELTMDFSQIILDRKKVMPKKMQQAPVPDNLESNQKPASVVYKWRSWNIQKPVNGSDFDIDLVARTHINGYINNAKTFRAFTMLDTTGSVFKQLPNQIGSTTATEIKNNCCRIVKQIAVSMLAGADQMKLGFTVRRKPTDPNNHALVHISTDEPKNLARTINVTQRGFWNVFIRIMQEVINQKSSEPRQNFVLMRDPAKPQLKLYDTTLGEDSSSEDENEESETDSDSDSDSDSSSSSE